MASDSVTFQEAARLIRQGVNPEDVGNMPYVGLEHIEEGSLRLIGVGNAKNVTSTKFRFSKGDILFGKLRPYFRKVIRPDFDGVCSTDIWVVRSKEGIDQGYLYYWMASNDFVNFATQGSEGTKMPRAKWEHVGRFQRQRLEESEQRAIAHILGSIDDKIELNRRMNETLEAMARAIFKSWFVDFDPVRAKADLPAASPAAQAGGRPTGLPDDIAALFPDSFEDSEMGEVPTGWGVSRLGNIADVNWGDTNVTKKSYVDEGFLAYSAKGPDGFLSYHDYDRTGVVVSAIGANSGHTWLAQGKWSCIKNTIRFWNTDDSLSTEYLFHATFGKHNWPLRGSAQPFVSQGDARRIKVLYPSNDLAKVFGDFVRPFYEKVVENEDEAHTLASLRDTMLPKLISGEMRVPDAEKFVEEVSL
jgi:type I restriction enzyme, S subunit